MRVLAKRWSRRRSCSRTRMPLIPVLTAMEERAGSGSTSAARSARQGARTRTGAVPIRIRPAGRGRDQLEQSQGARRSAVRETQDPGRGRDQETQADANGLGDRLRHAVPELRRVAGGQGPARMARGAKTQGHLRRRAAHFRQSPNRTSALLVQPDHGRDRATRIERSQSAEHPGAHRARPQTALGVHRARARRARRVDLADRRLGRSSCASWRTSPATSA